MSTLEYMQQYILEDLSCQTEVLEKIATLTQRKTHDISATECKCLSDTPTPNHQKKDAKLYKSIKFNVYSYSKEWIGLVIGTAITVLRRSTI